MIAWLTAAALAAELTGTWRVDLHLVHDLKVPVLGHSRSDSYTVQLWRVAGDQVTNEHCSIRAVTRSRIGRPTIPEAFARRVPPATAPLERDGDRIHVDFGFGRIGYLGDEMPTDPDDPGLVDHEGDGHPGATITVWAPLFGDVQVYLAQRTRVIFDGVVGADGVSGSARQVDLEQRVLGAENRLFARQPSIVPVPEESSFRMTRVPDGTTCADPAMAP